MPLTSLQRKVLNLLADHRDPESYIAGSTYLTRQGNRFSGDIDIFHDREERVAIAAQADADILQSAGLGLQWQRREPAFYRALISDEQEATKLEWVQDSDFRFFPAVRDPELGFVLHPADLATNKIMAAANRREPRDIVHLLTIEATILPLGAVAWAAVGKSVGFTPEGLINEVRRLARYTEADFRRVASDPPVDSVATMQGLHRELEAADSFVRCISTDKVGFLFLENGKPVQPGPDHLERYALHAGARRGHWPSSSEIGHAMLERYQSTP